MSGIRRWAWACVAAVGLAAAGAWGQEGTDAAAATKERFQRVVRHLDLGGEMLVYVEARGAIERALRFVGRLTELAPVDDPEARRVRSHVQAMAAFVKTEGLGACDGVGMSLYPIGRGKNRLKGFMSWREDAADTPVRKVMGGEPHTLRAMGYLPADTAFVRASNVDLGALWSMVRRMVSEVGGAEAEIRLGQRLAEVSGSIGLDVDGCLQSLGDEAFVSVQLSREFVRPVPVGGGVVNMPSPSVLAGVAVRDAVLAGRMQTLASDPDTKWAPREILGCAAVTWERMEMVMLGLAPTIAFPEGYVLMGTTPQVVSNALAVARDGGLADTPEYREAFSGLPALNNGMVFVSERFLGALRDVQHEMLVRRGDLDEAQRDRLAAFVATFPAEPVVGVRVNHGDGIAVEGTTRRHASELVSAAALAPVGMFAGAAIPAFTRARDRAHKATCHANMAQIEAAKAAWAMETGAPDNAEPRGEDLQPYLGRAIEAIHCPQGGVYELGTVLLPCRCRVHGEAVP